MSSTPHSRFDFWSMGNHKTDDIFIVDLSTTAVPSPSGLKCFLFDEYIQIFGICWFFLRDFSKKCWNWIETGHYFWCQRNQSDLVTVAVLIHGCSKTNVHYRSVFKKYKDIRILFCFDLLFWFQSTNVFVGSLNANAWLLDWMRL